MSVRNEDMPVDENPGKLAGGALYLHRSAIETLSSSDSELVVQAEAFLPCEFEWSVVKIIRKKSGQVSFLDYEDFFEAAFPALKRSCIVDLKSGQASVRRYSKSNPPILHRKELLLAYDDPRRDQYASLTNQLEELGLFQNMHKMGYRKQWVKVLRENRLDEHGQHCV